MRARCFKLGAFDFVDKPPQRDTGNKIKMLWG